MTLGFSFQEMIFYRPDNFISMDGPRTLFLVALAMLGLGGTIANSAFLFHHFYLWPLVRLAGYVSLLVYALLMLGGARYNTRP